MRQKYTPDTLPYHLVAPSLPGYTLSKGRPLEHDISQIDVARVMDAVMREIGFGAGYIAQGGDVGSRVARAIAVNHEACKGETDVLPKISFQATTDDDASSV
jgi:microsomal epoxide hydrolase